MYKGIHTCFNVNIHSPVLNLTFTHLLNFSPTRYNSCTISSVATLPVNYVDLVTEQRALASEVQTLHLLSRTQLDPASALQNSPRLVCSRSIDSNAKYKIGKRIPSRENANPSAISVISRNNHKTILGV